MNEQEDMQEKAILVGCQLPHVSDERFEYSMEELAALTKTADGKVVTTRHTKAEQCGCCYIYRKRESR